MVTRWSWTNGVFQFGKKRGGAKSPASFPCEAGSLESQESLMSLLGPDSSATNSTSGIGLHSPHVTPRMSRKMRSASSGSSNSRASFECEMFAAQRSSRHSSSRRSTRNLLFRPTPEECKIQPTTSLSVNETSCNQLLQNLNLKPMQFEVPCVDADSFFVGREWIYHELYEILVKSKSNDPIRGAVIHGCVGTGKTAILYQLARFAPYNSPIPLLSRNSAITGGGASTADSGFISGSRLSLQMANAGPTYANADWLRMVASHVVAYHFCQVDINSTCTLPEFLLNLIAMLATAPQLTSYKEYLANCASELQNLLNIRSCLQMPQTVFMRAVVEPLVSLRKCGKLPTQNYLILLDGIDEAEFHRPEYGDSIGSFVITQFRLLPDWIKVVFSVKTNALDLVRGGFPCHKVNLDNLVMDERLYRDVHEYVAMRVQHSQSIYANVVQTAASPSTSSAVVAQTSLPMQQQMQCSISRFIEHITTLSKGNFLYLKLTLNLIERALLVLKSASYNVLPVNLSEVFLLMFNLKFSSIRSYERVCSILNVCLASLFPLNAHYIFEAINAGYTEQYLTWEDFCERLLMLSEFLVQREDDTFVLFHPAFREWLIRREDGEAPKFLCDLRHGHALLAFRLSRLPGSLDAENIQQLGHHVLKAHIYKQQSRESRPVSSRDAQAVWLALAAKNIKESLLTDRNVFCANTKVSRLLLLAGASPDTLFDNEIPLLNMAARQGCVELASLLLEFDASPSAQDLSNGRSALMDAAAAGHLDLVQLLHQHGAQLSLQDNNHWSALVHAAFNGHVNVCSFLLQCDWTLSSMSSDDVVTLSSSGDESSVMAMQRSQYGSSLRQQAAQHALVIAASNGNTQVCQFLLEFADVNVDEVDQITGTTALCVACVSSHKETVQFLLSSGAKVSYRNLATFKKVTNTGCDPPLIQAVTGGCWEIVSSLLARGLDPDQERSAKENCSALMIAAKYGHIGVMELLLSRGASVQAVDLLGRTALSWAAECDHVTCATLLLDRDADVLSCDSQGCSSLHFAAQNATKPTLLVLLERGANLEQQDLNGNKPLDLALQKRNKDAVQILLRRGARLGPTTWTNAHGCSELLLMLLQKLLEDGNLLYRKNRLPDAVQRFQYALRKFPAEIDDVDVKLFIELKHHMLLSCARCKRKLKESESAIDLASKAILLRPQSFEAFYVRARCFKDLGNLEAAFNDISDALRMCPANRDARQMLSKIKDELRVTGMLTSNASVNSAAFCDLNNSSTAAAFSTSHPADASGNQHKSTHSVDASTTTLNTNHTGETTVLLCNGNVNRHSQLSVNTTMIASLNLAAGSASNDTADCSSDSGNAFDIDNEMLLDNKLVGHETTLVPVALIGDNKNDCVNGVAARQPLINRQNVDLLATQRNDGNGDALKRILSKSNRRAAETEL